ncbi:hypothetical protein Patl1_06243 [Pistacia atlantica]|uniref:Uncharacterized protein n=1 Tax=Pistacia atlantica TaxID=434234 RepID=A0ACC1BTJ2_9ROSI|nr:hypothetical protein Patl1_06243 [Pistacia atlantica]
MAASMVKLKLLIDTEGKRVLFAEAGKDFVDFLFYIFSLPVGTVVKLLIGKSSVGCLDKLYESIENLDETYMQPNQDKNSLLNPKPSISATEIPLLLSHPHRESKTRKLYTCATTSEHTSNQTSFGSGEASPFAFTPPFSTSLFGSTPNNSFGGGGASTFASNPCVSGSFDPTPNKHFNVSDVPNVICPQCKASMSREVTYISPGGKKTEAVVEGGFVKGVATYMVMDNLEVMPLSTISSITFLNKFNVKNLSALEERVVDFGREEGLKLLKASMECRNVLTSIFLANKSG